MKVANVYAQLSTAKKLKVGCIIVKDNRVISIGYNGMPSGWSNECEEPWTREGNLVTKPEVLHAEANAITKVARSSESCEGATLYCTHAPCIECAKLIAQSGIKEVYYETPYLASKGSGLNFLVECDINVVTIERPIMPLNENALGMTNDFDRLQPTGYNDFDRLQPTGYNDFDRLQPTGYSHYKNGIAHK